MDFENPQAVQPELERRRFRRIKLAAQVHCESLERREEMISRDLTEDGMFLEAKFPLPADSELSLTFRPYPAEPPVTCNARVVFTRMGVGMGIRFVDLSPEALHFLRRFIEEAG